MVELLQNTWKKAEVTHWIDLLDSFMFSQIDRIREFNNSKLCSLHKGWSGNFLLIKWYRTLIDLHVNISTSRTILPKFYVNILTQVIRKPIRNWIYSHLYISYTSRWKVLCSFRKCVLQYHHGDPNSEFSKGIHSVYKWNHPLNHTDGSKCGGAGIL